MDIISSLKEQSINEQINQTFTPELGLQQSAEVSFQNGASVVGDGADSVDAL
jgi:hypothetical protein